MVVLPYYIAIVRAYGALRKDQWRNTEKSGLQLLDLFGKTKAFLDKGLLSCIKVEQVFQ
jgi:hypothetical protein